MRGHTMGKYALIAVAVAATVSAFVLRLPQTTRFSTPSARAVTASASPMATTAMPVYSGSADWPADARVRLSAWTPEDTDDLSAGVVEVLASGNLLYAMGEVGSLYVPADDAATWTQLASVAQQTHQPIRMDQFDVLPAQGDQPLTFFALDASSWPKLYRIRNGETEVMTPVVTPRPFDGTVRRITISAR